VNTKPLSTRELKIWHAFKKVGETVFGLVVRDVSDATGLSAAEFGVLSRLEDLGDGELRQQVLADSMGWHKSRLSHQITRMQERGFVERRSVELSSVTVAISKRGRDILVAARPIHAASVRRHLLDRLSPEQARMVLEIFARLGDSTHTS
jgi:DNA-binding MarR family transcriptional regulator